MSTCAIAVTNSDGSIGIQLQPLQTNFAQCQFVVQSGSEAVNGQLLQLAPSDALTLLPYLILPMAVAWGFKQLVNTLNLKESESSNDF